MTELAVTEEGVVDAVLAARDSGRAIDVVGFGGLLDMLPVPPECDRLETGELRGIIAYEPDDLAVTLRPGTPVTELASALAESGQECPLEGPGTSVGGRIASGLTGVRRLGLGHVREWLLGGRLVTGEGIAVRFGAKTVKNVSGYDLPRLLCGSWGTLGVLTELTLRVRPRPRFQGWFYAEDLPTTLRRVSNPVSVVRTPIGFYVLLEGHPRDCAEQAQRFNLAEAQAPTLPGGMRISLPPGELETMLAQLEGDFAAELGVGVIHADPPTETWARIVDSVRRLGGRALIQSAAAPHLQSFVVPEGVAELSRRVKEAFDPRGVFAPWRFSQ